MLQLVAAKPYHCARTLGRWQWTTGTSSSTFMTFIVLFHICQQNESLSSFFSLSQAKQKVDVLHLQLQNLLYEVMHLQKEISKCLEFKLVQIKTFH